MVMPGRELDFKSAPFQYYSLECDWTESCDDDIRSTVKTPKITRRRMHTRV